MNKDSNIISISFKRKEKQHEEAKKRLRSGNDGPYLEQRIALLEEELDRVVTILIDTANLAEENRDYLIRVARILKESP